MPSANLYLVRSIYSAWEQGDYRELEWAHPEMDYKVADGPPPGTWTGAEGLTGAFRAVLADYDLCLDVLNKAEREIEEVHQQQLGANAKVASA